MVVVFMLLVSWPILADVQLGAITSYQIAVEYNSWGEPSSTLLSPVFGAESRYTSGALQIGATALYLQGVVNQSPQLILHSDVGVNCKIAFIDLGVGIGPSIFASGDCLPSSMQVAGNLKLCLGVDVGIFNIGVIGFYRLPTANTLSLWMLSALVRL
jgi:hypothetical protein